MYVLFSQAKQFPPFLRAQRHCVKLGLDNQA